MKSFFVSLLSAVFAFSATASAQEQIEMIDARDLQTVLTIQANIQAGLDWKVGDRATYKLDMGGFLKGSSNNYVSQDTGTGFWIVQEIDLMFQKQKVETLINKATGQIEKMLVNGQEQSIPKVESEVLEMKEARVTVAAGTFDCIYVKIRDKSDGKISEAWINPQVVPMSGTLKAVADSPLGKVVQEVTSMQFAPRN